MDTSFIDFLSEKLHTTIKSYRSVSGGDISSAYLIKTPLERLFLKHNRNPNALDMFMAEKKGLETIAATKTIKTPNIIDIGKYNEDAYLLLQYIETKNPSEKEMENFGFQLAELHNAQTEGYFGFLEDNFIGRLHQSNKQHKTWIDFYIEERLQPQFEMALKLGLLNYKEIPSKEHLRSNVKTFFNTINPSLLHGDLWSGNYLVSNNGEVYLIDPATYYGHNEIDIAMSKLFGSFSNSFYNGYQQVIPFDKDTNDRIELYQLYYLLVHLNMFGSSYYSSVKRILSNYFG
jgi:fructosamine-3-kinase